MRTLQDVPADAARPRLGDRIRYHEHEAQRLKAEQRDELLRLITTTFPPGEAFSASQLWQQPEVRAACLDADIATVKQLGKWLRPWCGAVGRDGAGIVWSVSVDDLHEDARVVEDDAV